MKKDPAKLLYYSEYGYVHDTICFWCGKIVRMDYTLTGEESRKASAGCVHHLDHDHSHNVLENLAGMHYGCHAAYHRSVRPLVTKGTQLSDEWKEKISQGLKLRYADPDAREVTGAASSKYIRSQDSFQAELYCVSCRKKFSGEWGVNQHHKRNPDCSLTSGEFECSCGKKFKLHRGLVRHLNNNASHVEKVSID